MIFTLFRAEDGAQTRDPQLGRLMLYRLSYFRKFNAPFQFPRRGKVSSPSGRQEGLWAVKDSNLRSRKTAELQSAPVGHFGNCPFFWFIG